MGNLAVSVACAAYDRTWPLIAGQIPIEGCDASFVAMAPSEAFRRAYSTQDFDITELSASSHILTTARGDAHYVAVPAFVSRSFRHSCFYIRTDRGIVSPADLRGKTIGITEYQMTAALWARGFLADDHGVRPQDIHWRRGGLEGPAQAERTPLQLPDDIDLQPVAEGATLSSLLESGDLDAVLAVRPPSAFVRNANNIGRLWPDVRAAEEAYFERTRIFPIMHLIGIRRSLVEQHPWLAPSVLKAFTLAKASAVEGMGDTGGARVSLPWLASDLARTQAVMGPDFWPYGLEANRPEIESMLRWSVEQGLSQRRLDLAEMFAPGT